MQVRVHSDPPVERRAFGAAVRELRGRRGLSLAQLGERAQVHDGYLRAVERAEVEPGLRTMGRIAAGLEVPLSTLMACAERRVRAAAAGWDAGSGLDRARGAGDADAGGAGGRERGADDADAGGAGGRARGADDADAGGAGGRARGADDSGEAGGREPRGSPG